MELELICSYYNSSRDYVKVLWDEEMEEVVIINYERNTLHRITEMKNMNYDMLSFMAQDFYSFNIVNDDMLYVIKDDVPYLQDLPCGQALIDELKEYNIEFREF